MTTKNRNSPVTSAFLTVAAGLALLPHCSPPPTEVVEGADGGDRAPAPSSLPGGGGGTGSGGASPGAPEPECRSDRDCAGSDCNAPARCEGGRCAAGNPCENPDADHCTVECVKTPGKAECVVHGGDTDHDGHGDQRCDASPGDDCNDVDPEVHGGAPEACNGVDDDCDGKVDVADGASLAFVQQPVLVTDLAGAGSVAIAELDGELAVLHGQRESMGLAWSNSRLDLVDVAGAVTGTLDVGDLRLAEPSLRSDAASLWVTGVSQQQVAIARRLLPTSREVLLGTTPTLDVSLSTGAPPLAVGWHEAHSTEQGGLFLTNPGVPVPDLLPATSRETTRFDRSLTLSRGDGAVAAAWFRHDSLQNLPRLTTEVRLAILPSEGAPAHEVILRSSTDDHEVEQAVALAYGRVRPLVAWTGTRFVVAWFDETNVLQIAAASPEGQITCGPLAHPAIRGSTSLSSALVGRGSSDEALLAYADPDAVGRALWIDGRCRTRGTPVALTAPDRELSRGTDGDRSGSVGVGHPAVTRTATGFAFAWIERPRRVPLTVPDADAGAVAADGGAGWGRDPHAPDPDADSLPEGPSQVVARRTGPLLCD